MSSSKVTPIKCCKTCDRCLISEDKTIYECWIEDYFHKVEPDQEACEIYLDRAKAEKEHLKWVKETMPELLDENGKMWKDTYVLLKKMEEVEKRANKEKKVVDLPINPQKPNKMDFETYKKYKMFTEILVDFWNIGVENNPIKVKNFAINRLNPDDKIQMYIINILHLLRKGETYDEIAIYILSEIEMKEWELKDYSILYLIRRYFWYLCKDGDYRKFMRDAIFGIPDEYINEYNAILNRRLK